MARKLRVEYEGAIYHVMNRGDRREAVFRDAADRELFFENAGRGVPQDRLAGTCVLSDEQSFSPCDGDAAAKLVLGNEVATGHLHATIQPAASTLGTSLWWALQGTGNRWALAWIFARRVRLRASQSGASRPGDTKSKTRKISLEQLSGISATKIAAAVAAGGSVVR